MKIDEIVALSKAGFTAEQIAQMSAAQGTQPTPTTVPTQSPVPTPTPEPTPSPVPTPQPTPTPVPTPNPIDALMAQVMNLTNIVQANALGNTNMPTPENEDDILAAIINPPTKEAKK